MYRCPATGGLAGMPGPSRLWMSREAHEVHGQTVPCCLLPAVCDDTAGAQQSTCSKLAMRSILREELHHADRIGTQLQVSVAMRTPPI